MNNALPDSPTEVLNFEQPFYDAYLAQHTFDDKRINGLRQAIMQAVKPGDIVADLGSGQGFLALFAVMAGAKRVYCVEVEKDHAKYIQWLAKINDVSDKLVILNGDAKKVELPEQVDVMICELISAGFYYEPQIQVMNHNLGKLKPGGLLIPESMESAVQLIHAQGTLYGLQLPPVTRWTDLEGDQILTDTVTYHKANFYEHNDPKISASVLLTATADGEANAIRVLPDIWIQRSTSNDPGIRQNTPSPTWGNPQVIWLKQPVMLKKGQTYRLSISYKASDHPDMGKITVEPMAGSQDRGFDSWEDFDPIDYVNRNFGTILHEDRTIIATVIEALKEMPLSKLKRVADVGAGPNFYPALLLASLIEPGGHIDLIEYSKKNRAFMQALLGDGDGIFYNKNKIGDAEQIDTREPWQKYESLIAKLGAEPRFRHTFAKAHMAARSVAGDIYWLPKEAYDFISAYFVPESITTSRMGCTMAINSLLKAVRPGGGFMIALVVGSNGWPAGKNTRFPAVNISSTEIQEIFQAIPNIRAKVKFMENQSEGFRTGYQGTAIVVGQKV